eukprot:366197-Chlamydomonas_euryale.AAC.21
MCARQVWAAFREDVIFLDRAVTSPRPLIFLRRPRPKSSALRNSSLAAHRRLGQGAVYTIAKGSGKWARKDRGSPYPERGGYEGR